MNRWSLPLQFCEPGDHKAATQLREIEQMLKSINTFNEGKGLPEITVVDIEVIVFDTTSSNTGMPESIVLPLYKTKQLHTYIYLFIIFYTGRTAGLRCWKTWRTRKECERSGRGGNGSLDKDDLASLLVR